MRNQEVPLAVCFRSVDFSKNFLILSNFFPTDLLQFVLWEWCLNEIQKGLYIFFT